MFLFRKSERWRKLSVRMLTLSAQTVSLVNDFTDLSIRNDVSYGAHKVNIQMMMTSPSLDGMLRASLNRIRTGKSTFRRNGVAGWNVKHVFRLITADFYRLIDFRRWRNLNDVANKFPPISQSWSKCGAFPVTQSLANAANCSRLSCYWFFFCTFSGSTEKLVISMFFLAVSIEK